VNDVKWHVYGRSSKGYTTLRRSPGLSPRLVAELERFDWGQTADRDYLDSLHASPGVWIVPRSDRVDVTRVLQGPPDSAHRATLEFQTLLVPHDVYSRAVLPRLPAALTRSDSWWCGACDWDEIEPTPSDAYRPDVVQRIVDLLRDPELHRTSLVAPEGAASLEEVLAAVQVLPAGSRLEIAIAHRALSDDLGARWVSLDRAGRSKPTKRPRCLLSLDLDRFTGTTAIRRTTPGPSHRPRIHRSSRRPGSPRPLEASEDDMRVLVAIIAAAALVLVLGLANLWLAQRNRAALTDTWNRGLHEMGRDVGSDLDHLQRDVAARTRALQEDLAALRAELDLYGARMGRLGEEVRCLATELGDELDHELRQRVEWRLDVIRGELDALLFATTDRGDSEEGKGRASVAETGHPPATPPDSESGGEQAARPSAEAAGGRKPR